MVGLSVWQGYIYMWRGTVGDSLGYAPTLCTVYGGWGRVEVLLWQNALQRTTTDGGFSLLCMVGLAGLCNQ